MFKAESNKKSDQIKVTNRDVNILLFLMPALTCLQFWIGVLQKKEPEIGAYFMFITALFLYYKVYKSKASLVITSFSLLILTSLIYVFIYQTNFNNNFSYILVIHNVVFSLIVMPYFDFSRVSINKLRTDLTIFAVIFILLYELSHPFAWDRSSVDEYNGVVRVYREGFVISHLACYYFATLGYFLYILNKKIFALILWGYTYMLGARIGLIYIGISILVLFSNIFFPRILKTIYQYRYWFLIFLITIMTIITIRVINTVGIDGLMVFTSGRSVFWSFGIEKIASDGLSISNLIGRGPRSSQSFNLQMIDSEIWMHNDFIDIMFNLGLIGLLIYLSSFFFYFKKIRSMFLFLIFWYSAFFNGFMTYDPLFVILLNTLLYRKLTQKLTNTI